MHGTSHGGFRRDDRGTTAIEFAILGPCFLAMIIGTIYMGMLLMSAGMLYNAVQDGARCAAVKTTVCTDSTATINYTKARYHGPSAVPTVTYTTPSCGKKVTASVTFVLDFVIYKKSVPLSATSCHP